MAEQSKDQSLPTKTGYTRELTGLGLFFWAMFLVLALISFDKSDPTLNHVRSVTEIQNKAGLFGAYVSGFLNECFGLCSFLWPLFFMTISCACLSPRLMVHWRRWVGIFILTLFIMEKVVAWNLRFGDFSPGGFLGNGLHQSSIHFLNPIGASLFWFFIFLVAIQLIINISWIDIFNRITTYLRTKQEERKTNRNKIPTSSVIPKSVSLAKPKITNFLTKFFPFIKESPKENKIPNLYHEENTRSKKSSKSLEDPFLQDPVEPLTKVEWEEEVDVLKPKRVSKPASEEFKESKEPKESKEAIDSIKPEKSKPEPKPKKISEPISAEKITQEPEVKTSEEPKPKVKITPQAKISKVDEVGHAKGPFPLPPLDILEDPIIVDHDEDFEDLESKGERLITTLKEFHIEAELVEITPGPVVTLFEVRPAPGVRVNKFQALSNDFARVLKAISVRILAPVPGNDTVGIEIPNAKREFVNFKELISTKEFHDYPSPLGMVLGKDTIGRPVYADLTKMPHMLIGGATGKGKSVFVNCILASLLYRTQPDKVKLLLIDPKQVEMRPYADEPHLIHPIVNNPTDAKTALEWATHEMDDRYTKMSKLMVRKIGDFNNRLATYDLNNLPENIADLEFLPYLVIVIDELSDLMLTSDRSEVEKSIIRLAQLGRAAGIHLILATQRPSVDVVTGLIKTNFPCRIAFKTASNTDSRTILGATGAEKLLGNGDMLYCSDDSIQRLHGAFLKDKEVSDIISYWKSQTAPNYKINFSAWTPNSSKSTNRNYSEEDELYEEVLDFVRNEGMASISKIQRRFKIGFNRAARLVEFFDAEGILEPAEGSKPRKVKSL